MPLRPQRRIPSRFNRPISKRTHTLIDKRYKRRSQHRKERYKRTMRKFEASVTHAIDFLKRWILLIFAITGVIIVGFVLFSPVLHIQEIKVVRTDARVDLEKVQQLLAPLFGRHLLFLTEREVTGLLEAEISDINSITVTKNYPKVLRIAIELDPLVLKLEIDDPAPVPPANDQPLLEPVPDEATPPPPPPPQDFLTSEGVYIVSPGGTDAALPVVRLIDWGVRPNPGDKLLEPEFLEEMRFAEQALVQQFGHTIVKRTVYLRAQEFHMNIGSYELWFDSRASIAQQLSRYRVFLSSIDPKTVTAYIDLRLTDRIIYK